MRKKITNIDHRSQGFLRYLALGVAEDEIDWTVHDRRYHHGSFDPSTMTCETRSAYETGDLTDTLSAEKEERVSSPLTFDWQRTFDVEGWGDLTRQIKVVGSGRPVVLNASGRIQDFKELVVAAAKANLRSQKNYIGESTQGQPQLILDGKVYRFTKGLAAHGLNSRTFFENGNAAAMIGDLLNNSVSVPNTPFGITYRLAAFDIGTGYFALVTAFRSPDYKDIEDIVDVEILHSVHAKRGDVSASSPATQVGKATPGFIPSPASLGTVSIANFRDAWQRLFLTGAKRIHQEHRHSSVKGEKS